MIIVILLSFIGFMIISIVLQVDEDSFLTLILGQLWYRFTQIIVRLLRRNFFVLAVHYNLRVVVIDGSSGIDRIIITIAVIYFRA